MEINDVSSLSKKLSKDNLHHGPWHYPQPNRGLYCLLLKFSNNAIDLAICCNSQIMKTYW